MSGLGIWTALAPLGLLPLLFFDRRLGGPPAPGEDELGTNLVLGAVMLLSDGLILTGFALLYTVLAPHLALVAPPSFVVQLGTALLAGDFLAYWHHRLLHGVPWLWASHVVHHQSRRIELGTGLRNHPFVTLTTGIAWSPLLLLGVTPPVLLLAAGLIGTWVILIHRRETGLYPVLPWGARALLNLPEHHRAHHHEDWPAGDCNYGLLLIVWDRLFGTYRALEPSAGFGVPGTLAVGPIGALLWSEWRAILGMAPRTAHAGQSIGVARGAASYVGAAGLLALAAAAATALGG